MEQRTHARVSPWHSIKTRASLFTLSVFVLGIFALSFYTSRLLKADMERLMGEQQFSTVSVMAHEINDRLGDRLQALEIIAKEVNADLMGQSSALQTRLEQRPLLQLLFNGGAFMTGTDGTAIAEVPRSTQRIGVNYLDMDDVSTALKKDKASVGRPVVGKKLNVAVFGMTVPIHSAQGKVIGTLTGVTNLAKPNFLDTLTQSPYGKTGGFLLIAAKYRLVVTATDKSRIMETLPEAGINAWVDRFANGYEGSAISTNPKGVEVLVSGHGIPVAGWYLLASLPTAEAFAPVGVMHKRMVWATLLLILITGLLTWWILKRQLSPLVATADAMVALAHSNQMAQLPATRLDEIGQLVNGFNRILTLWMQREAALKESEVLRSSILDSVTSEIAVLNRHGIITAVNAPWLRFSCENSPTPDHPAAHTGVGSNYLAICEADDETDTDNTAYNARFGIQAVLDGILPSFNLEYPCHSPDQQRWFSMSVTPLGNPGQGVVVSHTDITPRKLAEESVLATKNHLQAMLNAIPDLMFEVDWSGRVLSYHAPRSELLAAPPEVFLGKRFEEVLPPAANEQCLHAIREAAVKGLSSGCMYALPLPQGETWFELSVSSMPVNGDIERHFIFLARDVTDRKQADESLRIAATAFESQQGMVITDAERMILKVNQAFTTITGYDATEALGHYPSMLSSGRHDRAFYAVMTQTLEREGAWAGEIWNRRKNGEVYPESLTISAVKDGTGLTTHFVGIFSDISDRLSAQAQIDTLAFYDPLTQLPNRRLLLDRLEQALHTSTRHARKSALLFVDLDNFKTLNDTLGHYQGDLLLAQVAERLKTCIRDGDTVARLGSDEFVVMLEDLSENNVEAATQAETVGENVLKAFQQDFPLDLGDYHASPSIGITLFGGNTLESSEQPLKRAELAMFHAKADGRNTLRFFDSKMQADVSARAALEANLREAIQQQQFSLHYQPQVVGTGRITGVEVLLRWQHPQRGMVSPNEFIPLAEESGLILPIGQWVLDTACTQLAAWAQQPGMAHLTMAVNVSARQFKQPDFVASVQATLARTRANPKRLKLELTESMLVDDVDALIAKMGALKARGVTFSLDDFGTGYSSLAYLKRLPLDQLKIDQGFVRNIVTDPNDAAIAKMVVVLAESMGLSVIAEGVELQAQAEFLAHQGCHAYQGYLFSRPLPLEAFEVLARDSQMGELIRPFDYKKDS